MAIAAVPNYLQKDDPEFYLSAPPGHRFLLYFAAWGENGESGQIDWRTEDRVKKYKSIRGQLVVEGWTDIKNGQFACTIAAGKTPPYFDETPRLRIPAKDIGLAAWKPMIQALIYRQSQLAKSADNVLTFDAQAIAPFATGLGNEHPTENGFAFLNPYGLPYLPGSGVKGVLRQAARELESTKWGETHGWDERAIIALFGLESKDGDNDHQRGALSFWDVIPQIKGDSLQVEIMTPHQGGYYQGKQSPHDSGQPIPIPFLTVPPGSGFTFYVQCNLALLQQTAPELATNEAWKVLLESAFAHAFDWCGFGAKTAVGYGAMTEDQTKKAAREELQRQQQEAVRRSTLNPEELAYEEHKPVIDKFRQAFEQAQTGIYQAGQEFDSQRNVFIEAANVWEDQRSRLEAASLLAETIKWGVSKKGKERLKTALNALMQSE